MIVVTRLNNSQFAINPDLIERINSNPDTTLVMVDGSKYIVTESMDATAPRVQATLSNASPETVYAQEVIATVFGLDGEAIGASRTIVREVGPRAVGRYGAVLSHNAIHVQHHGGAAQFINGRAVQRLP